MSRSDRRAESEDGEIVDALSTRTAARASTSPGKVGLNPGWTNPLGTPSPSRPTPSSQKERATQSAMFSSLPSRPVATKRTDTSPRKMGGPALYDDHRGAGPSRGPLREDRYEPDYSPNPRPLQMSRRAFGPNDRQRPRSPSPRHYNQSSQPRYDDHQNRNDSRGHRDERAYGGDRYHDDRDRYRPSNGDRYLDDRAGDRYSDGGRYMDDRNRYPGDRRDDRYPRNDPYDNRVGGGDRGPPPQRGGMDSWRPDERWHSREDGPSRGGQGHQRRQSRDDRYDSRSRSPVKRSRTESSPRSSSRRNEPPPSEEGEVIEAPSAPAPRSPSAPPPAPPSDEPENPYKPRPIKNRPTRVSDSGLGEIATPPLAPGPPLGTPPPPPSDRPPTPPSPPGAPQVLSKTPDVRDQPVHRALQATKSMSRLDQHAQPPANGSLPHADSLPPRPPAPDRNALNPSTRVSTPIAKEVAKGGPAPKTFRRWTRAQDLERLHKEFFGTTTLENYDLGTKVGEGTFGVVTKATEKITRQLVALKKLITHNPRDGVSVTTIREIKILKSLDHANVVPIRDMVVEREKPNDRSERGQVFMVFPFMDHDLCGLLSNPDFKVTHSLAKLLFRQILEGMAYIHANNFLHRDIKTANILVDRRGGVMIADFGLARSWTPAEEMPPHKPNEYTNMVVTRWYRAPELLLGDIHYGPAVDMWSLGCVLGEMYYRAPILAGDSDRDQLFKIFSHCGPLNQDTFPGWDALPGFPDSKGHPWDRISSGTHLLESAQKWQMDRAGADLMMSLLKYDPAKRLSADDALDHPWFWISPKPAALSDNLIKVDSSHEMTVRQRDGEAIHAEQHAVRQQQLQAHRPQPAGGAHKNGQMGRAPPPPMPIRGNPYAPQGQSQNGQMPMPSGQGYGRPLQQPYGQAYAHDMHPQRGYGAPGPSGYPPPPDRNGMGNGYPPQPHGGMQNGLPARAPPPTTGPPGGGGSRAVPTAPFALSGGSGRAPPVPFALAGAGPPNGYMPNRPPAPPYGQGPPANGYGGTYGVKRPHPAGPPPQGRPGTDKRPRHMDGYGGGGGGGGGGLDYGEP